MKWQSLVDEALFGCAAFFACTIVSQYAQTLCLMSTRTPLLPRGINVATVCAGSMLAYQNDREAAIPCGVAAFLLLGGRALSFTPSSVVAVGAFGRKCIGGDASYASLAQRSKIAKLGRRFGCHTCGKRLGSFIADHQPPLEIIRRRSWWKALAKARYKYYPQCTVCSNRQAAVLRSKRLVDMRINHFFTLRPHHFTGALVSPLVHAKDTLFGAGGGGTHGGGWNSFKKNGKKGLTRIVSF